MRVLLVQQDMGIREVKHPIFPIGLACIASVLKEKHSVNIFDPNIYPLSDAFEELGRKLKSFKPDVVGISIRNIDTTNFRNRHIHYKTVRPLLSFIREFDPRIKIIAGGSGFSLFPKVIMQRIPEIDFGVYQEGEESMPELLDNIDNPKTVKGIFMRDAGEVFCTGSRPLPVADKIPSPMKHADLIDITPYIGPSYNIIGIQTKRGCLLQCGYCSYPLLNGSNSRLRNPIDIVDEIEYMVKNYGLKQFVFVDSVFNVPREHAITICRELIKRSLGVKFGVWCHVKGITEEFLQLLKDAGAIQIDFSPDAATNKGLAALKKGITEDDIKNVIKMAKKIKGVGFGFGFFSSLPGYNFIDMLKTLIMPFRIQLALPGRGGGGISYIRIEPDTHIREVAIKEGLLRKDDDLLPENENELAKMFYMPASQRWLNLVTDLYLGFFERILKPSAVSLYRFMNRLRGKKSIYDQKTGFVSFQRYVKK